MRCTELRSLYDLIIFDAKSKIIKSRCAAQRCGARDLTIANAKGETIECRCAVQSCGACMT